MSLRILQWRDLEIPVSTLPFVGTRMAVRLRKLGIVTLGDLMWHLPWRYDAYEETSDQALEVGQKINLQGRVESVSNRYIFPRRMTVTTAIIQTSTGGVRAVWFNQPYLENTFAEGTMVSLAGKVRQDKRGLYMASPVHEKIHTVGPLVHTSGLVPVYPETEGISSKYLRMLVRPLVDRLRLPDPVPRSVLTQYDLLSLDKALKAIHAPVDSKASNEGRRRLAFDELLLFQLQALHVRRRLNQQKAMAIPLDVQLAKNAIAQLPFELTKDQKIAAWEIFKDLERPYPMNRLLEGDVGSGKTIVALMAALQVAHCGHQTALLAPTEVVANQHYATVLPLAALFGVRVGLLTAARSEIDGKQIKKPLLKERIARGAVDILVGTHAVIQKDVRFGKLALAVVDEQHRFGIAQRAALVKGTGTVAHLLSMTATPIPRTLALTIFGDLDISLIREKPKQRLSIHTDIVVPKQRTRAYDFVRSQIAEGRQAFIICPRIEAQEAGTPTPVIGTAGQYQLRLSQADIRAVEREYERLAKEVFPDVRVAMLHGKMKPKEKERIMEEFRAGTIDILVATSVIEVGVDVPNAAVMLIEGAEQFGLAQLHQFRGRVGRAHYQSYCFLLPTTDTAASNERLKALKETDDGFALAEKDMALRGPGEFFGLKQSGMPDLAMAALADATLIKQARTVARSLLQKDPSLATFPLLQERLATFARLKHFE